MNKVKILRWVNPVLFVLLLIQMTTVLIMFFQIGVPNLQFVFQLHEYNGLLLVLTAFTHLILNWSWVRAMFFRTSQIRSGNVSHPT